MELQLSIWLTGVLMKMYLQHMGIQSPISVDPALLAPWAVTHINTVHVHTPPATINTHTHIHSYCITVLKSYIETIIML